MTTQNTQTTDQLLKEFRAKMEANRPALMIQLAKDKNKSNIALAKFHTMHPEGILAQKKAVDHAISKYVEAGEMKPGVLCVHGSLNDYHVRNLRELSYKSRAKRFPVYYHIEQIGKDIARAETFIAEHKSNTN